jgi:hypothetical protein
LSELEAMPLVEQLPNNVSVIMPSVDYTVTEPVLMPKPKEVFVEEKKKWLKKLL